MKVMVVLERHVREYKTHKKNGRKLMNGKLGYHCSGYQACVHRMGGHIFTQMKFESHDFNKETNRCVKAIILKLGLIHKKTHVQYTNPTFCHLLRYFKA